MKSHHHHHVALPFSIVHCFRQVFMATSRIGTELLYVGSSCSSMWRGPQEYVTYEFVPTSPKVPRMSGSSNFFFVMGIKSPYSCCFVGCFPQDLFSIARRILFVTENGLSTTSNQFLCFGRFVGTVFFCQVSDRISRLFFILYRFGIMKNIVINIL